MTASALLPAGITVLERGWLSSNNIVLHGGGDGAVLVDAGHVVHAAQTEALVRRALAGEPLRRIVNTHLHSDHCGGNATLQRALGCGITIPPGQSQAVRDWDAVALSYVPTGQRCERFAADAVLRPGQTFEVGGQSWRALAAPGHDPHSLILYNAEQRVAITADALWERGFGVVFPELDGEQAFDDVGATLDLIESLDARVAIPGHGAPFADLPRALAAARERLAAFRAAPDKHTRHAIKVLVKYHLMEERQQALPVLLDWFCATALCRSAWERLGCPGGALAGYGEQVVRELVASGALALHEGVVHDA